MISVVCWRGGKATEVFDPFFEFFAGILAFFYGVIPSYGLAIILLTVVVMVVVTPLTYKSTKSMLQMQRLQPQLKAIQKQYKEDRERLNQELMAFYKEHNLNPIGGCLPLIIQGPVFLVLYRVLRGLTNRLGGSGSGTGHVTGQLLSGVAKGSLTPWRLTDQPFNPEYVSKSSELYHSLSHTSKMKFLGLMDLSLTPTQAFKLGLVTVIPFVVLIGGMTIAQVIQNRQIQGRNPNQQVNPQQQAIMRFMPFMLPVFSLGFPAGLSLYYLIQSLARIGTQSYITRSLFGENAASTTTSAVARDDGAARSPKDKDAPAVTAAEPRPAKHKERAPKPGSSTRSQAAQRKQSGSGGSASGGRRSGSARSSKSQSGRRSGETGRSDDKKGQ